MQELFLNSPWQCDIETLLLLLRPEDDLLLLQDGVTGALQGSTMLARLSAAPATLWVLEEDVVARGLSAQISSTFGVLALYDIEQCYICQHSLLARGVSLSAERVLTAQVLESDALRQTLASFDRIICF
ncbi:sulfurtransferase complex subunit TusB [Pantoea sp. BRM17]|nr:sulfurtransferase complex subunit TusB [Pantoea sp. BRM17]